MDCSGLVCRVVGLLHSQKASLAQWGPAGPAAWQQCWSAMCLGRGRDSALQRSVALLDNVVVQPVQWTKASLVLSDGEQMI